MKIIHTADLHLDSRLETNLDSNKAKKRRKELISAFENTVAYAIENGVGLFLVAGDMFDTSKVTRATVETVASIINEAKSVKFLVLSGNHDNKNPFLGLENIPENLYFFSENWDTFEFIDVTVSGILQTEHNKKIVEDGPMLPNDKFNIVMLHGDINSDIRLSSMHSRNIDYLALGHLHEFSSGKIDERGVYAYSGCLESRGFDESGKKGFILVDTDKKSFDFISGRNIRTMYDLSVDISGLLTYGEIKSAMENVLSQNGVGEKDMVKIRLVGDYTLDTNKDIAQLYSYLKNRFFFAKIKDQSTMQINIEDFKNDLSLKGEFVRQVLLSDLPQEEKQKIIVCGIRAINGEEVL